MRSSAVALLLAGAVAAHTGAEHSDHIKFLRSLHSSNFPPTPVKRQSNSIPALESIGPALPSEPAVPLRAIPTAGTKSPVNGAPDLPAATINIANYPAFMSAPDVNSDQVKQWVAEVAASGVEIPNIPKNIPAPAGSGQSLCQLNPDAATKSNAQGNCWWSCGSCTRDTDVDTCPDKMTWGLTFDDGPSPYTPKVLNYLEDKKIKATFYVIGSNVIDKPAILQATYLAGHEIALHTWSHRALTTLSNEEIIAELGWNLKAIKDVIGVSPKTMRPPYGDIDDRVRAICKAMNLTPVMWTTEGELQYDSNDWRVNDGSQTGPQLLQTFNSLLDRASQLNTGFVSLQHDLYAQTVNMAVGYFLPAGTSHNPPFALQSVNECLKRPLSEAYRETSTGNTTPVGNSTSIATGTGTGTRSATSSTATPGANSGASVNTSGALPQSMVSFAGVGVLSVLVGGALALL
ncbi:chitin deacetylase [Rhizoctonia solani AG-3 Rhs1AP]|uniref:chitin deacetylase n=1 Tax=Rhizoctonia solani AG-3 Rhs1AP TaxID=1086054 RepID=A0A0A1UJ51_9AGAM|nr:chitin deacetylase [Rhizoctonia solani AG-3 Rhs1AP]